MTFNESADNSKIRSTPKMLPADSNHLDTNWKKKIKIRQDNMLITWSPA
jgi:hypothetical protein